MAIRASWRTMIAVGIAGAVLAYLTAPTQAGLGQALVRGITYGLQPSIGTPQNGPNFNQNVFNQRFSRNYLTDGASYEFSRFFGSDSFGNPDTINTGLFDLQLGAPPN